jgi:iron-sulfur cluster repair protein YtfE (RIC family)
MELECKNLRDIALEKSKKIRELEAQLSQKNKEQVKLVRINADLQKTISQLQHDNYFGKWDEQQRELLELRQTTEDITRPYKERIGSLEQSLSNLTEACTKHIIQMIGGDSQ